MAVGLCAPHAKHLIYIANMMTVQDCKENIIGMSACTLLYAYA